MLSVGTTETLHEENTFSSSFAKYRAEMGPVVISNLQKALKMEEYDKLALKKTFQKCLTSSI